MAPKSKSRLVDQPPSASSSEDEEQDPVVEEEEEDEQSADEESGEEESEEEEEPKTAPPAEKKSQKPLQTQQQKPHSSSTESDGSGSDSDADSGQSQQPSPSASDFHVKPNVPAAPTSKSSTKRPSQETQQQAQKEKESRSRKKPKTLAEEEEKKSSSAVTTTPNSTRLWNDEDQIALLKGMVEFKSQGFEPSDMSAFHDFIKGKLQVEVSKSQLTDKLRRLKKKLTALKTGEDPVFTKPHDYLVFELSKKIWAPAKGNAGSSNNGITENVKDNYANGKAKKTAVEVKKSAEPKKSAKVSTSAKPKEDEKQVTVKEAVKEGVVKGGDQQLDFQSKYPLLAKSFSMVELPLVYGNSVDMLKKHMSSIPDVKAKVLEEKWKKLQDEEHVLLAKRLELIAEHFKLVVGAKIGN